MIIFVDTLVVTDARHMGYDIKGFTISGGVVGEVLFVEPVFT